MKTEKPTSLELTLVERYSERLDRANLDRHHCKQMLSRIAMIYSNQLHFEYPEQEDSIYGRTTPIPETDKLDTPPREA